MSNLQGVIFTSSKIFKGVNINLIDYLNDLLKDHLYETKQYTDECIFNLNNKNIKLLIQKDKNL
jgi:hypothetical protein